MKKRIVSIVLLLTILVLLFPVIKVTAATPNLDEIRAQAVEQAQAEYARYKDNLKEYKITFGSFSERVEEIYRSKIQSLNIGSQESSWTYSADNSIYNGSNGTGVISIGEEPPDRNEKSVARLFRNFGSGITGLLASAGLDLNTIIYGRVGGYTNVNWVSLELKEGNPFGIASAIVYSLLRGIVYAGMSMAFSTMLIGAAITSSGKGYEKFRTNIGNFILVFMLLTMMPNIVDISLYCRDQLLAGVSAIQNEPVLGGNNLFHDETKMDEPITYDEYLQCVAYIHSGSKVGTTDYVQSLNDKQIQYAIDQYQAYEEYKDTKFEGITGLYHAIALRDQTFISAAMFFSLTLLSVYFLFMYVSVAVCMLLTLGFFPIVGVLTFMDRHILTDWCKAMLSFILTPVVDAVILFAPLFVYALGAPRLVTFITCMVLIPARAFLRSILKLGGSFGAELAGIGSMMMVGRLVGQGMKNISEAKESFGMAREDRTKSIMYDKLSETEAPNVPLGGFQGMKGMSAADSAALTAYNSQRADTMKQYANYKNFEDPVFKDTLSDKDRADFYKQRSAANLGMGVGRTAGSVAGAGFGLSATMFSGTSSKAMAMSAGAGIGGMVGSSIGKGFGAAAGSKDSYTESFGTVDVPQEQQDYLNDLEGYWDRASNWKPNVRPLQPTRQRPSATPNAGGGGSPAPIAAPAEPKLTESQIFDICENNARNALEGLHNGNISEDFEDVLLSEFRIQPKAKGSEAQAASVREAVEMYQKLGNKSKSRVDAHMHIEQFNKELDKLIVNRSEEEKVEFKAKLTNVTNKFKQYEDSVTK